MVVNFNGAACLPECLRAVASQQRRPDRTIVVDNASTDGSFDRVATDFPWVERLPLATNVGFAAANNLALQRCADCTLVALLNPDAFPAPGWLAELDGAAAGNPDCASFASQLRSARDDSVLDGAGDTYHVSGLAWRQGHGCPPAGHTEPRETFSACAAAALYRRDAVLAAGGFDESFFCYAEDVDLGFRLRLLGHRCLYVPAAVARHVGYASSGRRSPFALYHGHRNLIWTFLKNMPGPLLAAYLPQHLAANLASLLWFSTRGQTRAILRAERDALLGLPGVLRRRRSIQRCRRVGAWSLRKAMARGWFMPYSAVSRSGCGRISGGAR